MKRIIVWSQENGKILHDFCSHTGCINSIDLKNGLLLSGSDDQTIKSKFVLHRLRRFFAFFTETFFAFF